MDSASDSKRRDAKALDYTPGRGFIYAITCQPNQKRYIGQTIHFRRRIYTHRSNLRNKKHWCIELQDDWNKFGSQSFLFEILQEVSENEMNVSEAKHILETITNLNGCYNYLISIDPTTGTLTPISKLREKHSQALKKAWADPTTYLKRPIRTRWSDPDQRRIQSESQKKRYLNPEQRKLTALATKKALAKKKQS